MALTYYPEDTSELNLKTQRDITCESCGTRRTIDGYNEPTIASCIGESCRCFFVVPAYPFQNADVLCIDDESDAKEAYEELLD